MANVVGTDDTESLARALLLAGRAHRALGDAERADLAWAEVAGSPPRTPGAEHAEALRRIGMEDYQRRLPDEAQRAFELALSSPRSAGDRRGEERCRTWPG